jgi:hypothetical protein
MRTSRSRAPCHRAAGDLEAAIGLDITCHRRDCQPHTCKTGHVPYAAHGGLSACDAEPSAPQPPCRL